MLAAQVREKGAGRRAGSGASNPRADPPPSPQAAATLFLVGKVSSWFTSLGLVFVGRRREGGEGGEGRPRARQPTAPPRPHVQPSCSPSPCPRFTSCGSRRWTPWPRARRRLGEERGERGEARRRRARAPTRATSPPFLRSSGHYKKFVEPYVAKIPRASTVAGGPAAKKAE